MQTYATRPNTVYVERPGVEFVVKEGFNAAIPQIRALAQAYQQETGRGMYLSATSTDGRTRVANATAEDSYEKLEPGTKIVLSISPTPKNLVGRTLAELKKIIPNAVTRKSEK